MDIYKIFDEFQAIIILQSRQPCPMENQYHETEKTVFLAKKQYHSLRVLFFRSHFDKARLCKGMHKTVARTSLQESEKNSQGP